MVHKFYAVTQSGSLYEVSDEIDQNGWPTVKKISGFNSPNAQQIGSCLKYGKLVGVGDYGICLFNPTSKYGRAFEHQNIADWGTSTIGVVGLFLEQSEAEKCLASGSRAILDAQYKALTHATLEAIGNNHPIFVIGETFGQSFHFW